MYAKRLGIKYTHHIKITNQDNGKLIGNFYRISSTDALMLKLSINYINNKHASYPITKNIREIKERIKKNIVVNRKFKKINAPAGGQDSRLRTC